MANQYVVVRLKIIEARNLHSLANNRSPTNSKAVAELQILNKIPGLNQKYETEVIKESVTPKWNCEMDFLVPEDQLENAILNIKVWDSSSFGRSFLGEVALPLSELEGDHPYASEEESWFPLEVATEKARVMRHIKLKIGKVSPSAFTTPKRPINEVEEAEKKMEDKLLDWVDVQGDEGHILNHNLNSNFEDFSGFPNEEHLQKGALGRIVGTLKLVVQKPTNFFMDSDYFLVIAFGAQSFRTKSVKKLTDSSWKLYFFLVVREAEKGYQLRFSFYNLSKFGQNDLIATASVKMADLLHLPKDLEVSLPLDVKKQDGHQNAEITFSGRFITFNEMKKNFWLFMAEDFCKEGYMITKSDLWAIFQEIDVNVSDEELEFLFQKAGTVDEEVCISDFLDVSNAFLPEEDLFGSTLEKLLNTEGGDDFVRLASLGRGEYVDQSDFVTSGFLTETHARKGWLTRIINYVTNGQHDIGADNANVLVQDRESGQLIDEKIPTSIRLGIRVVYRNKFRNMRKGLDSKLFRNFLHNQSVRQGKKFNDPKSKEEIKGFIEFHGINMSEMLESPDSFQNFNEFFYRKLKPGARSLASSDPKVAVSPADARMMAFPSISDATKLWIKGSNFSRKNLLQDSELANYYKDGSLALFRLAPQDYHRYHAPVDGIIGPYIDIHGTYFTVNPMAIREKDIDVFTENKRSYTVISSKEFDKVAYVIIGAMLVGSIIITSPQGTQVKRLDEIGYFAFGGSTIICLFKKGVIEFDADLVENSKKQLETLVKVGNSIGKANPPVAPLIDI